MPRTIGPPKRTTPVPDSEYPVVLSCGRHVVGERCVQDWLERADSCLLCVGEREAIRLLPASTMPGLPVHAISVEPKGASLVVSSDNNNDM
jgi:hypothetical protein